MYHLPIRIIELIYSFDPTYHNIYNRVKQEFEKVNNFWSLVFHNQSVTETMSLNKMKCTQKQINNLAAYWNEEFINQSYLSINSYQNWYATNGVCSAIHISDKNEWGNNWKILKQNISCYKFLKKKKCV